MTSSLCTAVLEQLILIGMFSALHNEQLPAMTPSIIYDFEAPDQRLQ